jgi:hypothetical protein
MRWIRAAIVLGAAAVVLGASAPAGAHISEIGRSALAQAAAVGVVESRPATRALDSPIPDAVPVLPPEVWLLVTAALAIRTARARRAVAGLLIAVLAVFAFEAGVHSAHHIGDPAQSAECVVAAASSHVYGVVGEPVVVIQLAATGDVAMPVNQAMAPRRIVRTDRDRAPPALS